MPCTEEEAERSMKRKGSEPTISQVADMAGVSIATVSRVLNDPTKVRPATVEKVSAAIDALYGYKNKSHVHDTGKAVER